MPATNDLGVLTIDPRDPTIRTLIPFCLQGSPTCCLIATVASQEVGRRVTVHVDHGTRTGRIGITYGDFRYERALTKDEFAFAAKFDNGKATLLRKPLNI